MKKTLLPFLLLITTLSFAQLKHSVTVQNGSFSPSNLTIIVGDTVEWTNIGGFHAIEGLQSVFPSNPESFGNSAGSAGWVYSFVFSVAGTNNYRCGIHTTSMFGTVTVQNATSIIENVQINSFEIYPNPANDVLNFKLSDDLNLVEIYDVNGKMILQETIKNKRLNISSLNPGVYLLKINTFYKKLVVE